MKTPCSPENCLQSHCIFCKIVSLKECSWSCCLNVAFVCTDKCQGVIKSSMKILKGGMQSTFLSTWPQTNFSFFNVCWTFQVPEVDFWVIPIIQGFVQVEELVVNYNETSDEERSSPDTPPKEITCVDDIHPRFTVALISRRSRHRAGRVCLRGVMLWFSPVAWAATSN